MTSFQVGTRVRKIDVSVMSIIPVGFLGTIVSMDDQYTRINWDVQERTRHYTYRNRNLNQYVDLVKPKQKTNGYAVWIREKDGNASSL